MKHLILISALALLACSGEPPMAPLEPNSVNPHRITTPSVNAADSGPEHICCTFFYGFCPMCMTNKAQRDSVCAPMPGWENWNPVPTMWGQPGTTNR